MSIFKRFKYWLKNFEFLQIYNSPFQRPRLIFHCGKIRYGTPYFFPRKWVKDKEKTGYLKAKPKKIGFDFVGLGWKTKWTATDYRHEWNPIWSFVFFKWQICLKFSHAHFYNYWEAWLYYHISTDQTKSKKERLEQCIKEFPQNYTVYSNGKTSQVDYYPLILKNKWLKRK